MSMSTVTQQPRHRHWLRGSLAQTRIALVAIRQMVQLAWRAYPVGLIGIIALEIAQGLFPLGLAWVTKGLFDALARLLHDESLAALLPTLVPLLTLQALLVVLGQLSSAISSYADGELGRRLALTMHVQVYEKINSFVGLGPFEDPKLYNTIEFTVRQAHMAPAQTVRISTTLLRSIITLFSFMGILLAFNPLLAGIVLLAVLPQLYVRLKLGQQHLRLARKNNPGERLADYYGHVLSAPTFTKELRLFNLAGFFIAGFQQATTRINAARRQQEQRELRWQALLGLFESVVAAGTFIGVVVGASSGRLSIGDVALYINAVASLQGALSALIYAVGAVHESVLFYRSYMELLALPQPLPVCEDPQLVPPLHHGIELRNVSFRYNTDQPWVLHQVNLWIPAGSCVALVGLNGAGKTTLVKLLARFYDPTEGQILWDGMDIRQFDPQEYRQRLGTIFQDFQHFDLTAQVNIGFGEVTEVRNERRVQHAAEHAGIHNRIMSLPNGYQTVLSRWLADEGQGIDLSGGEWQKVALARMFMREADLLMLDEPTAALDAQAEYELYQQFAALMAGRTSLLISHRFSSVRMADLIAVLENGQITEYGPHSELLRNNQSYALLYRLQAAAYQ